MFKNLMQCFQKNDPKRKRAVSNSTMRDQEKRSRWSPIERRCLSLLHQINSRASLLKIHAFMLRNALETNVCLLTKFIASCSSVAAAADPHIGICYARSVFDRRPHRDDAFLCNCMIKAHVGIRQFPESITLYRDLRRDTGFAPNSFTFTWLTNSCGLDMAIWEGLEMHNHVLKLGFCVDMFVSTALVDMYAKFGKIVCARDLFDEMTERSQVSWTAVVVGYARSGDTGNAKMLFDQMPDKDTAAFNAMIDAYVKLGDIGSARNLFDEISEKNVVSWTTMIHGYCENGDVDSARSLFDAMPEKNLLSWNAMINGCCQNKQLLEALRLFREMQLNTPFEPDGVTIASVLPAIAGLGALDLGDWVHQFVQRKKLDREANVCNALVDMYAKCGNIDEARRVFFKIPKKEAASWNAMINGFAINGCGKEALETFSEMIHNGFRPNEITMIGVLSACNHSGLVEEGMMKFKEMEVFGLRPQIEHYGCMIGLLGRAGLLDETEKLIESMPYEANGIILSSFLFACCYSKDVSRAERVIKKAIKIEPYNNGNYVMLRNLYAMEGRWRDVEEIKEMMRMIGSKKEVGCSAIEIDNTVLEFVAGHSMHLLSEIIHLVIRQLWMHMKGEGSD
ncbi:pentatricopeptide repeat-containing protein At2g44880-like [Malania oleifera]|uniref:pentatricopeptide repeat-containing protein At2g44880-like n=1 Tax=Malania oleifera TaxID=397392 RepID=UPI0025AE94A7|nr:pentatricopeptide repeat-containing protein At2g44880-like [Malania oleifera]